MAQTPEETVAEVIVTGSRIQRLDYVANSPITTVSADAITANTDVTLDTFMNTLPQVNPAGTTTSNNPSNGGQSNVNLRGLGANRNLVLIDGRRPMVSQSDLTVDLNTIPQALIESIEVITGGAGAVYGADAVAGVVNIKTKSNFNGLDIRSGFSNHIANWDSREYNLSALLGSDFADNRGNAVIGFDFSQRDGLIKSQRPFSAIATSTTGALPEGVVRNNGSNSFNQATVDQVFQSYGFAPGSVPIATSPVGFNMDGTMFGLGVFNRPQDVVNFKYPIDLSVNTRFFPDVYSYNFDAVNILTLPLKRRSFFGKFDYELGGGVEAFAQVGYTTYNSVTGIAPTPMPTGNGTQSLAGTDPFGPTSALVTPGLACGTAAAPALCVVSGSLVVPATNPYIPADLATLLASRTGNDPALVGTGAAEPFLMGQRTLPLGLRTNDYENEVVQYMLGFRGDVPFLESWRWEAYASEGRTEIDQVQAGNVNAQRLQALLEAPTLAAADALCDGGYNPFGRQPISADCVNYLEAVTALKQEFQQRVMQAFVSGNTFDLPAGPVGLVIGAEYRDFEYTLDPGAAGGAIYGFNSQAAAGGTSTFKDAFAELLVPLLSDAPFARKLELSLGYRYSENSFQNTIDPTEQGDGSNDAYKLEMSWQPIDSMRARASYQRAVRAPNFQELFDGSTSAPQYFDPCTFGSGVRTGPNAAAIQSLCTAADQAGVPANGRVPVAAYSNFAPLPGGQITTTQTGNTDLKPEVADTITLGLVWSSPWDGALSQLRGSIDYYNIKIKDVILAPDPNIFIADCYNYFGNNPGYSSTYSTCNQIIRSGAGTISRVNGPNGINFPGENGTEFNTDGIDVQVDYGIDMPSLFSQESRLNLGLFVNYLLSFERQDRANLPTLDYKGTVSYFGQGLGSSFPEFKVNLNANYMVGPVGFNLRARWIDSMENRAAVQFIGEPSFTGVPSVTYFDASLSWEFMEGGLARIGVNNLTDKEPPLYAPSVQSGTDPSLYDVIGRRIFGQLNFKF